MVDQTLHDLYCPNTSRSISQLATSADTESEVRSEAFWVVLNAASCGSDAQVRSNVALTYRGVHNRYCSLSTL